MVRNSYLDTDRGPDLGFDGILRGAVEGFDAQVLFDPFEEQFDLPAAVRSQTLGQ